MNLFDKAKRMLRAAFKPFQRTAQQYIAGARTLLVDTRDDNRVIGIGEWIQRALGEQFRLGFERAPVRSSNPGYKRFAPPRRTTPHVCYRKEFRKEIRDLTRMARRVDGLRRDPISGIVS